MRRIVRIATLSIALAGAATSALGQGSDYINDIVQRDRAILPAWRAITPGAYARQPWIKSLEGTTFPVERTRIDGKPYYLGSVCKPHDCADNNVVFLIALDHSGTYGLLRSRALKVNDVAFGQPGPAALQAMKAYLDKQQ